MCESNELAIIKEQFKKCTDVLTAIGDETRQHIIVALIDAGCSGIRVGEIKEKTHLSRPAVSHHLKILKESGIVNVNRIGTKNYYYLDLQSKLMLINKLMSDIEKLLISEKEK
ncbi:metalloregulator ArsR/SmtB family transcription factor [Clostridium sp. C2-6-12]|uniref:ArsR/SmtB family transcription factor n=1 Tax=Clostridium sp. C2-6-12 TaxID=2698832 RepID=UPI0013687F04|nr:metalloregulator ArsR/SmtB family transcription factor [Clostridium sp. C2-6-12]